MAVCYDYDVSCVYELRMTIDNPVLVMVIVLLLSSCLVPGYRDPHRGLIPRGERGWEKMSPDGLQRSFKQKQYPKNK